MRDTGLGDPASHKSACYFELPYDVSPQRLSLGMTVDHQSVRPTKNINSRIAGVAVQRIDCCFTPASSSQPLPIGSLEHFHLDSTGEGWALHWFMPYVQP